jgi:DNA-binding NarL/FixJ family response regulator
VTRTQVTAATEADVFLVVGRNPLLVMGVAGLLSEAGFTTQTSSKVTDQKVLDIDPALLILLLDGPDETVRAQITNHQQKPIVLVVDRTFTGHELADFLLANVVAIIEQTTGVDGLLQAIRIVLAGQTMWTVEQLTAASRSIRNESANVPRRAVLTHRETTILKAMNTGGTIRSISVDLGISPKTVEAIQSGLYRKLGVRNKIRALEVAKTAGLLS